MMHSKKFYDELGDRLNEIDLPKDKEIEDLLGTLMMEGGVLVVRHIGKGTEVFLVKKRTQHSK